MQGSILIKESFLQSDPATWKKIYSPLRTRGFSTSKQNRPERSDSWTLPASERELAAKPTSRWLRPAMTQDGTLNEEMQRKPSRTFFSASI